MIKNQLAPSILNADFSCIIKTIRMLEKSKVDLIHLDVMDGHFVPNISFGPMIVDMVREKTTIPLSIHLMIDQPERYIKVFSKNLLKEDTLIIHVESVKHLDRAIQMILDEGLKAGVAMNPDTLPERIRYVSHKLDTILIMTVNPGFGGQKFIPSMILKISDTKELIHDLQKDINIQVDGGINLENILAVNKAGANIIVVGSEIFHSEKPDKAIKDFQKKLSIIH